MKKFIALLPILLLTGIATTQAQLTNIYSFTTPTNDISSLTLSGNTLYGLSYGGGIYQEGNIFSIHTDGSGYKDLWDFIDTGATKFHSNGEYPYGSLIIVGNKLYGMTANGGNADSGTVFSINTDGSGYRDLWDFHDTGLVNNANGIFPYGTLLFFGNKLYGFADEGGAYGYGLIFSLDTNYTIDSSGHGFKDLWDFADNGSNGAYPYDGILTPSLSGNKFYGTTFYGGKYNYGCVYSIDTNGKHFKDIWDFHKSDGEWPFGTVSLSGTKLFGMTYEGASGYNLGNVFTVDTAGKNFKVLAVFDGPNGSNPVRDVTLSGNTLYGMTVIGGTDNVGVIFSVDTTGDNFTDLFSFDYYTYGGQPQGSLTLSGDTLYGITSEGGEYDYGTIFRIDTNQVTGVTDITAKAGTIHVFPNPSTGVFNIQMDNGQLAMNNEKPRLEIYNELGKQIFLQLSIVNSPLSIDLSNQPSGIYLYRVLTENGNLLGEGKLLIQK